MCGNMYYKGKSHTMKYFALFIALLIVGFNSETYAQKESKDSEIVVAEIGKNKITAAELEKAFKKNMSRSNDNLFKMSKDSILDFVNLYINFRLKVTDAIDRGFLKDSSVITEIEQNRKILAESFYYDKVLTEPNVNKFLEMRKKEYKVAIILASIKQNADMIDTTSAYNKIRNAQIMLKTGTSFEEVASTFSEDYETGKHGGVIPNYITSGKVQRPIEIAIQNTKAGEVYPHIVKTSYGYFLIKVLEVRDRELVRARHILIAKNESRDSVRAYQIADSVLKLIRNGADFEKLAKEISDDAATAANGGDLGGNYSRSTGMETSAYPLVAEFESSLFELRDGEISGVVPTNFGSHILKRESSKQPDLKSEYEELRKIYKRLYFKPDQTELLDSLKKQYNFRILDDVLYQFAFQLDTNGTNVIEDWDKNVTEKVKNSVLYEIMGKKVPVSELVDKFKNDPKMRGVALSPNGIRAAVNSIVEPIVFAEASKNLEKEFPDFESLMKEFRDGILLFKVEAMEVWDKMKFDTLLAKTYYDSTKAKYMTEDTYDISEIYFLDKNTADSVYNKLLTDGSFDEIAAKDTQRSGYREKNGNWGKLSVKTSAMARYARDENAKPGQILKPYVNEPGFSIIRVNGYFQPRIKTFEEAIPDFSPQYQEILQNKLSKIWLDSIRKKNPVKINDKEINKLISENN